MDKRQRKLLKFEYGQHWALIEGEGDIAVVTFGSVTAPVREAIQRLAAEGQSVKLVALRLLAPALPDAFEAALAGVEKVLVVEQTHSKQFYRYLRSEYDLPKQTDVLAKPGPLPYRPAEIVAKLKEMI